MNKEDILARSRLEKLDEGLIAAENQGRKIGYIAFLVVFLFLSLFNFIQGQPNFGYLAMFWAFVAAESFPKYRFTGKKDYLALVILGAFAALTSLAAYIVGTMG